MKGVGSVLVLGVLVALLAAGSAGAYPSTTPGIHDFGEQTVGTESAAATFTISAKCNSGEQFPGGPIVCFPPGGDAPFVPNVTVTGPFVIIDDSCELPLPQASPFASTCTFRIAFVPTVVGQASGIVDVGDAGGFGKAAVRGTGVALAAAPPPPPATTSSPKKCKKTRAKRAGSAKKKKKCRKKKRR